MAILWAWSDEKSLTERFFHARKVVIAMGILARMPAATYQAFLKMLTTWTVALAMALFDAFRRRMQSDLADTVRGRAASPVFGVDGSRLELPRTESNEAAVLARQGASAVAIEGEADGEAAATGAFAGGPRPPRPPEEGQQPADVADDDVPRRDRVALGLADSGRPTAASATTCGR